MSSEEFEIGDRVRIVEEMSNDHPHEKGDEFEIVGFGVNPRIDGVQSTKTSSDFRYQVPYNRLELVERGSDLDVEDVDAIAVEVDDPKLSEAIQEKAFENDWSWPRNNTKAHHTYCSYLIFGNEQNIQARNDQEDLKGNKSDNPDQYGDDLTDLTRYHLPQDWNKVVEFLEQNEVNPTLNGHEAEITKKASIWYTEIEVGFWSGKYVELVDFRHKAKNIGITSGTVTIKGEEIDIEELYQFIEDVKEVINQ